MLLMPINQIVFVVFACKKELRFEYNIPCANCAFDFVFLFSNVRTAYAHITNNFANIILKVGWSNEPPLVGELNNVIVQVNQTSSGKNGQQTPVINALASMDILVKYR
jgi:hypothetical protein